MAGTADTATPRRTGTATVPPKPAGGRKAAVIELLAIPMIPLGALAAVETVKAQANGQENEYFVSPYAMDIETLAMYQGPIADAVVDLAESYPVLGSILDRISTTTPFVALVGVAMAVGAQIAENHGKLPASARGISRSLVPREELAKSMIAKAKADASQYDETAVMGNGA